MQTLVTVIPTFNRRDYLRDTLCDLQAQVTQDVQQHVVVVVDGSTDGTIEMLASDFPEVAVVLGTGDWYYTRCMNEGFQKAHSFHPDFILTMNDDVRLPSNYLSGLLGAMNREHGVNIMGSISVTEDTPHRITFSGIKDIKWWRFKYISHLPHYHPVDPATLSGTKESKVLPGRGMLIPAKLLKDLKGFEASMVQYGSDDDFCLRAARKGVGVKVSYDAVVHSYDKLTGDGNPVRKQSLKSVLKSFNNRYSTLYLPKTMAMINRHGNRALMPLTLIITIIGSLKANLNFRRV